MAHDTAFIDAIKAAPDDDAPRLVYADWLDENGAAGRAEFIRLQVAIARGAGDRRSRSKLLRRERRILGRPAKKRDLSAWFLPGAVRELTWEAGPWLAGKLGGSPTRNLRCRFARGFADGVELGAADWLGGRCPCLIDARIVRYNPETMERVGEELVWIRDTSGWPEGGTCPRCNNTCKVAGHGDAIADANPIREVEFADVPPPEFESMPPRHGAVWWRHDRWPGVRFYLPPPGRPPEILEIASPAP